MMHLATYQVVFIRHKEACLYGELIQTMADRHTCWLRPLALYLDVEETGTAPVSVVDLRNGPDVICPSELVQPALDTEWLYLLGKMGDTKEPCNYAQANQHLRQFLQMLFSN